VRAQVRNICIDDFATKKGQTYGTLMVDYETSKVVDMIPSRDTESVTEWLRGYQDVETVSRDGSTGYARAIGEALPKAKQVTDRFHLVKNLIDSARNYMRRKIPGRIRMSNASDDNKDDQTLTVTKLSSDELCQIQKEESKNVHVRLAKDLYSQGYSATMIAEEMNISYQTARKYINHQGRIENSKKGSHQKSNLDPYKETIITMHNERYNRTKIYHAICKEGYTGSYSNLRSYVTRYVDRLAFTKKRKPCSGLTLERRRLISLLYRDISHLEDEDQKKAQTYINGNKDLQNVYVAVSRFRKILQLKDESLLEEWTEQTKGYRIPELSRFVRGIERDLSAVKNAITMKFSNGVIEGIINKIKVIKRIMYGRCSFELLRVKVLML